mgnify:CR=1 FL=1
MVIDMEALPDIECDFPLSPDSGVSSCTLLLCKVQILKTHAASSILVLKYTTNN